MRCTRTAKYDTDGVGMQMRCTPAVANRIPWGCRRRPQAVHPDLHSVVGRDAVDVDVHDGAGSPREIDEEGNEVEEESCNVPSPVVRLDARLEDVLLLKALGQGKSREPDAAPDGLWPRHPPVEEEGRARETVDDEEGELNLAEHAHLAKELGRIDHVVLKVSDGFQRAHARDEEPRDCHQQGEGVYGCEDGEEHHDDTAQLGALAAPPHF
mmetsp:Transcript_55182/g.124271  ORF Transcript_55182/g.124271 Transcript_55182/m.124271 type:complete len:211 (-) Transcript_55182:42-674(-)